MIRPLIENEDTANDYQSHKITTPDLGPGATLYLKNTGTEDLKWKVNHATVPSEDADWIEEKSEGTLSAGEIDDCEIAKMRGCLDLLVKSAAPDTATTFSAWLVIEK